MKDFYIAMRMNPTDIFMGRNPADMDGTCAVCANTDDAIDYLDEARVEDAREDAVFAPLPLPDTFVIIAAHQPGYRIDVIPNCPREVSTGVFEYCDIKSVNISIDSDLLHKESQYTVSGMDYREGFKLATEDMQARAVILADCLALSRQPGVDEQSVYRMYQDVCAQVSSPTSLPPLPIADWARECAQNFEKLTQENPEMAPEDVRTYSRLHTVEHQLGITETVGARAILTGILRDIQPELKRVASNEMMRQFEPKTYLKTLQDMVPADKKDAFTKSFVESYKSSLQAGSGTREAALSAAVAACKQMSFDAFVRHDHDTQNIWDDIGEKATLNQERWNELHADSRDEVSIED